MSYERRLRLLAEAKGFRLDDTGLFPATQSSGGKRVINWFMPFLLLFLSFILGSCIFLIWHHRVMQGTRASASLKFETENEVFDFLGFPRLEPHERNL